AGGHGDTVELGHRAEQGRTHPAQGFEEGLVVTAVSGDDVEAGAAAEDPQSLGERSEAVVPGQVAGEAVAGADLGPELGVGGLLAAEVVLAQDHPAGPAAAAAGPEDEAGILRPTGPGQIGVAVR